MSVISRLFALGKAAKDAATAMFPGLKNVGKDVASETSRLGTQGAMELASALFNGHAFVPYGPGQYTPSQQQGMNAMQGQSPEAGQEQGNGYVMERDTGHGR
jgi:hypothetical protein